jgi:hypothetical protein
VNAHDLMSLVAAATLIYYRATPNAATLRERKARDAIHEFSMTLAAMVPLYRIDGEGKVSSLAGPELERAVAEIRNSHVLDHPGGAALAVHTSDFARAIESLLKREDP